jgi:hypothetical protein
MKHSSYHISLQHTQKSFTGGCSRKPHGKLFISNRKNTLNHKFQKNLAIQEQLLHGTLISIEMEISNMSHTTEPQ